MSEARSQKVAVPRRMIEARIDWLRAELARLENEHTQHTGALRELETFKGWMDGTVVADKIPKARRQA